MWMPTAATISLNYYISTQRFDTCESLSLHVTSVHRPLAYSTLADLVHHVRSALPLADLSLAVNLFSKNVHDELLPSSIQTMSCKLLLNLVECIQLKSEQENGNVSTAQEDSSHFMNIFPQNFFLLKTRKITENFIFIKKIPKNSFLVNKSLKINFYYEKFNKIIF